MLLGILACNNSNRERHYSTPHPRASWENTTTQPLPIFLVAQKYMYMVTTEMMVPTCDLTHVDDKQITQTTKIPGNILIYTGINIPVA